MFHLAGRTDSSGLECHANCRSPRCQDAAWLELGPEGYLRQWVSWTAQPASVPVSQGSQSNTWTHIKRCRNPGHTLDQCTILKGDLGVIGHKNQYEAHVDSCILVLQEASCVLMHDSVCGEASLVYKLSEQPVW